MAVTLGPSGTPGQTTTNLDAVFSTSLANYHKTLVDNITKSNILFYEMKKKGLWESEDGGTHIHIPLMYALSTPDSYSGYDVLSTDPTDGVTAAIYQWAQAAVPCSISGLEEIQNRQKIVSLIKTKIEQAEMGFKEWFTKAFLQGSLLSGGSSLSTPYVSPVNGSSFINPILNLVGYDATPVGDQSDIAMTVGGLAQATYSWWKNWVIASGATTYAGMLLEWDKMYDLCSRGPGGPPDIIWCDEITKRLLNAAYYSKFQTHLKEEGNYPFDALKFRGAKVVCDEFIPDAESATTSTATYGTAFFLNSSFLKMKYDSGHNFVPGDFRSPINQDAKVKQIIWAGQAVVNNRRKMGVIGKIARTLS